MPVLRYVVIDPGCKTYTTTFEEAFLWARELAKDGPLVEIKVEVWDKEPHNPEADIQETHSFAIMDPKTAYPSATTATNKCSEFRVCDLPKN